MSPGDFQRVSTFSQPGAAAGTGRLLNDTPVATLDAASRGFTAKLGLTTQDLDDLDPAPDKEK
ncbi:MAG: hypothetical protein ACKV22_21230 [Bryobacteraceae bacterium]